MYLSYANLRNQDTNCQEDSQLHKCSFGGANESNQRT
jgi:hypothetical protein